MKEKKRNKCNAESLIHTVEDLRQKKLNKKRIAKLNLQYVNEHVCYKFQTKMQLDTTENINMN